MMPSSALLILFAMGLYGLVHSWLASLQAKRIANRWLGAAAERYYRLLYNLFGGLSFLPVLYLVWVLPDRLIYDLPSPWALLALVVQAVAVIMLVIGLLQTGVWSFLGLTQALGMKSNSGEALVVTGLYRWVRHPLYTAGLAFIWFTPRLTVNLFAFNLGVTAYLLIGAYFEERKLLRQFGDGYRDYQQTTPMLLPYKRPRPPQV